MKIVFVTIATFILLYRPSNQHITQLSMHNICYIKAKQLQKMRMRTKEDEVEKPNEQKIFVFCCYYYCFAMVDIGCLLYVYSYFYRCHIVIHFIALYKKYIYIKYNNNNSYFHGNVISKENGLFVQRYKSFHFICTFSHCVVSTLIPHKNTCSC